MTVKKIFGGLIFVVSLVTPAFCNYSVVNDFPTSNTNPGNVWSYGYETVLNGPFTLHSTYTNDYSNDHTNVHGFYTPLSQQFTDLPAVLEGTGPQTLLLMHPGSQGQLSVIRFTAPNAGTYSGSGGFSGLDMHPTSTDVHAAFTSGGITSSLFDGAVNTYGIANEVTFSFTQFLNTNDTVDFAVGYGSDGSFYNDSTGFEATVTPEPVFYGFLGLSLSGMFAVVRFRRNKI